MRNGDGTVIGVTVLDLLGRITSFNAQHRGLECVDRIEGLAGSKTGVTATVLGAASYHVEVVSEANHLVIFCSCPFFTDRLTPCKHLWAVSLVATERGWLLDLPSGTDVVVDEAALDELDDSEFADPRSFARHRTHEWVRSSPAHIAPPPRPAAPPAWQRALEELTPAQEVRAVLPAGSQLVYVVSGAAGETLTELPLSIERLDRKKNGEWSKPQPARLTYDMIPDMPDADDRWALSLMHASSSFPRAAGGYGYGLNTSPLGPIYLRAALVDVLLPRLCPTGRVRLRHAAGPYSKAGADQPDAVLSWDDEARWRFVLEVVRVPTESATGDAARGYRVGGVLTRGEERADICEFALITDSIAVRNNVASPFDAAGGLAWGKRLRRAGPLDIPVDARLSLVNALARSGIAHLELPSELQWEERAVPPVFRVSLDAPDRFYATCRVRAEVQYESTRAPIGSGARLATDDGRALYRRDVGAELAALARLRSLGVSGLEPHAHYEPSIPERRVTPLVHALVAEGWIVEAEGVRYRALAPPRLRIRSAIDWFELDAADVASDAGIDVMELVRALSAGRRTVTLGDGTVGMLPEDWLARVAPALALGEVEDGTVRFKPSQVALLDALLAAQPQIDWDEGFARARNALARFEGVRALDPPPTFTGALRDYQRESLGWMQFLREFGFGGCLADDMGLARP